MTITRRAILKTVVLGAGASALESIHPMFASGQAPDSITAQIRADLERHASFGDKFSGGPGDLATADWISGRLRDSGYRVRELEFDAPFFVKRSARFATGATAVDVVPQPPVVPTGEKGITGALALIGNQVGDVRGKIALFVAPNARHVALGDGGIGATVKSAAAAGARAIVIVTTVGSAA